MVENFFKSSCEYIDETVSSLKKGRVRIGCKSPGGRNVYVVEYGENKNKGTANYSSAIGAHDFSCYSQKERPCVFLFGGVHGGEFEGCAAILNLFSLLETGADKLGRKHEELLSMMNKCHVVFIPCANPDGRARVPFESVANMPFGEFRYYDQGTWEDGSLCNWPDCKKVHPMRGYSHLGGYFNDDGINIMHDDFFDPMSEATKLILDISKENAPEVTGDLHGAADKGYGMYATGYASNYDRDAVRAFEQVVGKELEKNNFHFEETLCFSDGESFNLEAAIHAASGALAFTWESYQGVVGEDGKMPSETVHKDILDAHFVFFKELFKLAIERFEHTGKN